jgi:hypothetical protein
MDGVPIAQRLQLMNKTKSITEVSRYFAIGHLVARPDDDADLIYPRSEHLLEDNAKD